MNTYLVRVFLSGIEQGVGHQIKAKTARYAMDALEARMGLKCGEVRNKGTKEEYIISFHAYSFRARRIA